MPAENPIRGYEQRSCDAGDPHHQADHEPCPRRPRRLSLGETPVKIPEPLATRIRDLVGRRRAHAAIGSTDDTPWLFPGGRAHRPISPERFQVGLTRLGIPARAGRAAALMDLTAQLPAVVLSKLLGISLGAAVQHVHLCGGVGLGG